MINNGLKKVGVTDGMSNDCYIFETNAPDVELEKWADKVAEAMYNGDNSFFINWLSENYFVKLLYDSEIHRKELRETFKCDICFDMSMRKKFKS